MKELTAHNEALRAQKAALEQKFAELQIIADSAPELPVPLNREFRVPTGSWNSEEISESGSGHCPTSLHDELTHLYQEDEDGDDVATGYVLCEESPSPLGIL